MPVSLASYNKYQVVHLEDHPDVPLVQTLQEYSQDGWHALSVVPDLGVSDDEPHEDDPPAYPQFVVTLVREAGKIEREHYEARRWAGFLNNLVAADYIPAENLATLFETRVPSGKLVDHPTVQVTERDGEDVVGFLGLLNGLIGKLPDGFGHLTAIFDDDGKLKRFVATVDMRQQKQTSES